jgi:hypothetical protein
VLVRVRLDRLDADEQADPGGRAVEVGQAPAPSSYVGAPALGHRQLRAIVRGRVVAGREIDRLQSEHGPAGREVVAAHERAAIRRRPWSFRWRGVSSGRPASLRR